MFASKISASNLGFQKQGKFHPIRKPIESWIGLELLAGDQAAIRNPEELPEGLKTQGSSVARTPHPQELGKNFVVCSEESKWTPCFVSSPFTHFFSTSTIITLSCLVLSRHVLRHHCPWTWDFTTKTSLDAQMSHVKMWLLIHRLHLKGKGWNSVILCNMDSNWYNEIFELKFYRLMIISKPFGAFDFMEKKVKLAWYVEKNEGLWWGASSIQERKYFSLEETKYQVLCCCCHFSSYMEKTTRNWNNESKEPFTGKKIQRSKQYPWPSLNTNISVANRLLSTYIFFIHSPCPSKSTKMNMQTVICKVSRSSTMQGYREMITTGPACPNTVQPCGLRCRDAFLCWRSK